VSKFLSLILIVSAVILQPVSSLLFSQNVVGMKEEDVTKYMNVNEPDFSMEKGVTNSNYKYLRYATSDGLQTVLVFFNNKGVCKEVRLSLDRSLYTAKVSKLDSMYLKQSKSEWIERKGKRSYSFTLIDDKWYYTLTIKEIIK